MAQIATHRTSDNTSASISAAALLAAAPPNLPIRRAAWSRHDDTVDLQGSWSAPLDGCSSAAPCRQGWPYRWGPM